MTSPFSVLIINPNTSVHMTEALERVVGALKYADVTLDFFTAPKEPSIGPDGKEHYAIASINSGEDSVASALHCYPHITPLIERYDRFLVACYSAHPLLGMIKEVVEQSRPFAARKRTYVTGIFEASVATSLSLVRNFSLSPTGSKVISSTAFGIITTGNPWKDELTKAVNSLLQADSVASSTAVFGGVETTGLSAAELHTTPQEEVQKRIIEATERLLKSSNSTIAAICLGCAGMSGMETSVRQGCQNALGEDRGEQIFIVDGVLAGLGSLVAACKSHF